MGNSEFGDYLRRVRTLKGDSLTQQIVADRVGRTPMWLSNIELGKCPAPKGEILTQLISAIEPTSEEREELEHLAFRENNTLPNDLCEFVGENRYVYAFLRRAFEEGVTEDELSHVLKKGEN